MEKRGIIIILSFLAAIFLCQPVIQAASLFTRFDNSLEKEIGYYNYQGVLAEKKAFDDADPGAQRVKTVLNTLTVHAKRNRELDYQVTVVEDPTINAFALPGGYIFVNSGLLAAVANNGELAGALAHELAHVELHHGMKALYRTVGMGLGLNLLIRNNKSKYKVLAERMAALSLTMVQLGYSREAEFEADRHGVELMTAAGYNKNDLINFWERMEARTGDSGDSGIFRMFATHPPLSERILRVRKLN